MLLSTLVKTYTPDQYLALEEQAEFRSEYRDGEIVTMSGGTTNHNKIALNFCSYFKFTMRGQGYEVFINDVKLWMPSYRHYTYPDIMIISGNPIYQGEQQTVVTNPQIIVEVLSRSTRNYDIGDKFKKYRSLPTLREYVTIDQYDYGVEQYVKNGNNQWLLTEYTDPNAVLSLGTVNFEINFSDLYENVNFTQEETAIE